jgi:deazaflavin-dependent oxidoreductase (nitroreductase family)
LSQQSPSTHDLPQTRPGKENEKAPSFMIPIFKLPVFLYRLRLGWLLGKRFMQITHVGRRSGKVRKTVLAVLRFDETTRETYAVSAWKGSDWYYNIQTSPALKVETGSVRYGIRPMRSSSSWRARCTEWLSDRKIVGKACIGRQVYGPPCRGSSSECRLSSLYGRTAHGRRT